MDFMQPNIMKNSKTIKNSISKRKSVKKGQPSVGKLNFKQTKAVNDVLNINLTTVGCD